MPQPASVSLLRPHTIRPEKSRLDIAVAIANPSLRLQAASALAMTLKKCCLFQLADEQRHLEMDREVFERAGIPQRDWLYRDPGLRPTSWLRVWPVRARSRCWPTARRPVAIFCLPPPIAPAFAVRRGMAGLPQ